MVYFPDDTLTVSLFPVLNLNAGRIVKYSHTREQDCSPAALKAALELRLAGSSRESGPGFRGAPAIALYALYRTTFPAGVTVDENRREHQLYIPKVQVKLPHQATYTTSRMFTTNLSNKPPVTSGTRSFEMVPDILPDVSLSANSTMSASASGTAPLCSTRCRRLMTCSSPSE